MQDVLISAQPFLFLQGNPSSSVSNGGGGGGGLTGAGSPEGVVTAEPGTTYLDTATNNFWDKRTGSGNTGWVLLIG